jgi:surface antigen
VAGQAPGPAHRRSGYDSSYGPRQWLSAARFRLAASRWPRLQAISALCRRGAMTALLFWVAACSMPYQAAAIRDQDDGGDITGTVATQSVGQAAGVTNSDIAAAGGAASTLFEQGDATTASWKNPLTGASGTVLALASAYQDGTATCRDFLSSYVRETSQAWLEGEACRSTSGRWNVRDLRRWTRS